MRLRALAVFALLIMGCNGCSPIVIQTGETEAPRRVFDAKPLVPEGWYETIHSEMVECSGYDRPFDEIEWYVTEPAAMRTTTDTIAGLYSGPYRIYLDQRFTMSKWTIAHEILHYLSRLSHRSPGEGFDALVTLCTKLDTEFISQYVIPARPGN